MTPNETPGRVLAIAAHPDDIDFGLGGTIAHLTAGGSEVVYCVVTDGDAGGFDPEVPRSEIPAIRRAEQRAAAEVLGAADVMFLGYRDGELTVSHGLRRDIARVIRKVRPDVAVVQSPVRNIDRMYASHPDHIAAGEAGMQAIYPDARNPFAHPTLLQDEGLEEWAVPQTWIVGYPEPTWFRDITDVLDRKVAALRAHESQTAHMDIEAGLREWGGAMALAGGLPEGAVAEAFRVLDTA
ncbi:MAG: PIG-L deacetylase family protein [Candidatus Nanopelagicales bacterium]